MRRLPDGRPLEIIVETAGESTEQTDVLELIRETWREVGIKLFSKPSQREAFRNRVFSGETVMSVWSGIENGARHRRTTAPTSSRRPASSSCSGRSSASTSRPRGKSGEPVDIPEAKELQRLYKAWLRDARRARSASASGTRCSSCTPSSSSRSASSPACRSRWWCATR